jgi:hypothetical protein
MAAKTTPLADGTIFKSIEDMKGSILMYNHGQNKGFKVSKSTLTGKYPRYSVVCATYQKSDKESNTNASTNCPFSVCCRPVAGEPLKWRVTKCSLNHSCTNEQKGRKRNYDKTTLASANIPVISTTATPLAGDTIFKGIEDMKGSIFVYNHGRSKGFKVSKSCLNGKDPRYSVVCATYDKTKEASNCQFRVLCRPVNDEPPKWRVTNCSLNHSCNESQEGRKRNYNSTVLTRAIPAISGFAAATPNAKGFAQKIRLMAQQAGGYAIKKSQAHKIAKQMRTDDK